MKLPDNVLSLIHSKIEKRPSKKDFNFNYIHQEDVFDIASLAFEEGNKTLEENLNGIQQQIIAFADELEECSEQENSDTANMRDIISRMRKLLVIKKKL